MVEPTKVNCVTVVFGKQPLPPKIEELYPWFFARYGRWICDNMLGVGEGWNCNRAPYYIYIYVFIVKTVFEQITLYDHRSYTYHKHPNGPEIGPAFSSIFMFVVIFVLLKTWHLPLVYIMVVSFGTSFPLGFMKNHCFIAVGVQKCMLNTLKIRYVFWMALRFATAPAILFHHFNFRTVFAVISHTSAFLCMYRHCQALTYVMIIGLWLDRLPGSIFLQAFQQVSIVPVSASTFVQKYTMCVHRSTTEMGNVTWSEFTEVQKTCAT